jgi:hypothetical protein
MPKILVVDDQEHVRLLYSEELKEAGYEVVTAEGGYKLRERIEADFYVVKSFDLTELKQKSQWRLKPTPPVDKPHPAVLQVCRNDDNRPLWIPCHMLWNFILKLGISVKWFTQFLPMILPIDTM